MGVYIKNMEMPTEEYGSMTITVYPNGHVAEYIGDIGRVWDAVPVPPHGRLIDADALADVFRSFIAMYNSCPFSQLAPTDKARRDELQTALAEVINTPTIIPAEEGKT